MLKRLAKEVSHFVTEQQTLARANATIRSADQQRGLLAPHSSTDTVEDHADRTRRSAHRYKPVADYTV